MRMNQAVPLVTGRTASAGKRARRAANISLDPAMIDDAKALGINISRACEAGLEARISEVRRERWREENREAIESSNAFVEKYGLPLAAFRMF